MPAGHDFSIEPTPYRYIRARDIKSGKITLDDTPYIDEGTRQRIKKYIINAGDIAITIVANIGDIGYANKDCDGINLTENAVRLTSFDENVVYPKYLAYYLAQPFIKTYMENLAAGAAQSKLGIYKIEKMKVELPRLSIQKEIVRIIDKFDRLIEFNRNRIKTLEQMAENLYKEWFVRFRFPGHEAVEFENGIPKGWEYQKLNRVFDIRYGKDHKNIEDGNIPIFGSGGIMRYGDKSLYDGETVLIPRKGTLNNIMYYKGSFWTVDTMFYTVLLKENFAKYAYYMLSNVDMESYNTGAALPSMTTDILYHLKMLVPDDRTLKMFDGFVSAIFEKRDKLTKINENLIKQRDLLLPRLMSGKLEV